MAAPEDGEEWKYSIDEVGEEAEEATEEESEQRRRIEPGSLTPENAFFVALGVLIALGTLAYGLGII